MKSDRKPPLVKSPLHLRPRRVIRSVTTPLRTPLPASSTKIRMQASNLRPEYRSISCEIKDLERMVQEELGKTRSNGAGLGGFMSAGAGSMFERGKFYDAYSARRNERLKRKLSTAVVDENEEPKTASHLGFAVESAKKEETVKRATTAYHTGFGFAVESAKKEETKKRATTAKKSIKESAIPLPVDRSEHPRYALRSIKKPPLPVPISIENSAGVGQRKTRTTTRVRRN